MKKIKDMTQPELEKLVGKVVRHSTDRYDSIMKEMMERFRVIEDRINYGIEFPNTGKEELVRKIGAIVDKLSKIYEEEEKK